MEVVVGFFKNFSLTIGKLVLAFLITLVFYSVCKIISWLQGLNPDLANSIGIVPSKPFLNNVQVFLYFSLLMLYNFSLVLLSLGFTSQNIFIMSRYWVDFFF